MANSDMVKRKSGSKISPLLLGSHLEVKKQPDNRKLPVMWFYTTFKGLSFKDARRRGRCLLRG